MGTLSRTILALCVLHTLPLLALADSAGPLQDAELLSATADNAAFCQADTVVAGPRPSRADQPWSGNDLLAATWPSASPVHPIWQIDLQAGLPLDLDQADSGGRMRYVTDVYRLTRDFSRRLLREPARLLTPARQQGSGSMPVGIQLDGGWSVGLGYDSGAESFGLPYTAVPQGGRAEPSAMLLTHRRF